MSNSGLPTFIPLKTMVPSQECQDQTISSSGGIKSSPTREDPVLSPTQLSLSKTILPFLFKIQMSNIEKSGKTITMKFVCAPRFNNC
jgi:hypothetical protein